MKTLNKKSQRVAILLAILAAAVYGLASTGSVRGAWEKAGRHLSEMTGGLIGKKPGK